MKRAITFAVLLFTLLAFTWAALAQDGYDLSWWTVDGGGATFSTGRDYILGGTIGQPDAGAALTGDDYSLVGGYWSGARAVVGHPIYLPVVMR
jgi:hypothetical protein